MFMIAVMTTAALSVHAPNGFFAQNDGFELPLVYGGLAFLLAFSGFGAYSLDAAFGLTALWTPTISWIAVGLGVLGGLGNRRVAPESGNQPACWELRRHA